MIPRRPPPGPAVDRMAVADSLTRPEAFAQLFDRHATDILTYLSRRVGDTADDLVSEVFLAAFRERFRYDPERAEVRAWLFGIAANLARNHHRAENARYRALARAVETTDTNHDAWEGVDAKADAARIRPRLAAALASLADHDREVLLLVAWGGLGYAEVAATLDIPIGTVRSRLHRARRVVREHLTDADVSLLELS